jgi:hypothetical protein
MFERANGGYVPEPSAVPVEAVLADGTEVKGRVLVAVGKTLPDILNGGGGFIEFEPYGGERRFVAKSQIVSIKLVGVPKAASLNGAKAAETFDPHAILGVPENAEWEEIRAAYHRLAKLYHPDRYANAELPGEVGDYLAVMVRRVNAAYAALEVPQKVQRTAGAKRPAAQTSATWSPL